MFDLPVSFSIRGCFDGTTHIRRRIDCPWTFEAVWIESKNSQADHGRITPRNCGPRTTPVMKIHHLAHNEKLGKVTDFGDNLNIEKAALDKSPAGVVGFGSPLTPRIGLRPKTTWNWKGTIRCQGRHSCHSGDFLSALSWFWLVIQAIRINMNDLH